MTGYHDAMLRVAADALDDLERSRIAAANRLRALTGDGPNDLGLPADDPLAAQQAALVDALGGLEHATELDLKRTLRKHPLGPWVKATTGVGEKQGARLLAAIGDPYWNTLHDRPRTVSELWAYCGLHVIPARHKESATHPVPAEGDSTSDPVAILHPTPKAGPSQGRNKPSPSTTVEATPNALPPAGSSSSAGGDTAHSRGDDQSRFGGIAPRRTKGQRANWCDEGRKRAFLVAESCIKKRNSPYRAVYDAGREKYADALHQHECPRCGTKGKPAAIYSPLSLGHQHARALRLVMKAVLKDLWLAARELHPDDKDPQP